jgi:Zn-finger nucleic acid-binding protein
MELTCPKCHGAMRSYERNGVTIDQCTECRGIFLDRGELDRLIDAENAWHGEPARPAAGGTAAAPSAPVTAPGAGGLSSIVGEVARQVAQAKSSGSSHGTYGPSPYGYPKKRKKSFLDELFS